MSGAGVVSPFGAAAVAVLGLLLGLALESAAPSRGAEDRPGWYRPAGWVVMGLALVLLVLAVPTASETAPSHRRPTANAGPGTGASSPSHPGPSTASPGRPG